MPQPVRISTHAITVDFSPDSILLRPNLAHYPALISAHWNDMEARVAILMAALMGEESKTVVTIFLALTGDAPRKAFVDAVVGMKLKSAKRDRFLEIQAEIGRRYSERNAAVHGAWGISPVYPDKLLWGDARDSIASMPDIISRGKSDPNAIRAKIIEMQQKLFIWDERDFKAVVSRMEETRKKLDEFGEPYLAHHFPVKKAPS